MLGMVMAESVSSGVLDSAMITAISDGVAKILPTVTQVLGIVIPAGIGVSVLVAAANFAMKKVKGILSRS